MSGEVIEMYHRCEQDALKSIEAQDRRIAQMQAERQKSVEGLETIRRKIQEWEARQAK